MKRIFITLTFLSITLITQQSKAQVPAGLVTALNHTLDSMKIATGAISLSAAIQFNNDAIWNNAVGISSQSPMQSVTVDDAYLIGSVTKTITSACVLQLVDEGVLSLDDSLHKWLPSLPYIDSSITIRQLLNHTSGLFDVLAHPNNQDSLMANMARIWTPEELIARFMMPPNFPIGSSWGYCNTNYMLLDMIIKSATGNRFYTEIRNRFFTPLAYNSFSSPSFESLNAPVAHVWIDLNGDGIQDDANTFYMNYKSLNSTAGAAGSYFATPTDCTKWTKKVMRGDLFSANAKAQMQTTVFANGSQGGLYGLGVMKNNFDGLTAWGHGGDLAYHASSWYFPEKDMSITVLTNDNNVNSWALLPVVKALLRTYTTYQSLSVATFEESVKSFEVYPNPFKQTFNVDLELKKPIKELQLRLIDINGKTVHEKQMKNISGSQKIAFSDLQHLSNGNYTLSLSIDGDETHSNKIVKI